MECKMGEGIVVSRSKYVLDSLGSYHDPLAPPPPDDPPLNPPKLDPPLNPPELELLNPLLE